MPYSAGRTLPGERSSRLGHLEVIKSPLVRQLVDSFEAVASDSVEEVSWQPFPECNDNSLDIIFSVDGSIQVIEDERPPHKALAFVKTSLVMLDQEALSRIDKENPHPFALRDLMKDSALYHATVFPLRHISVNGLTLYDAVRKGIYESMKDASLDGKIMETLKWIAYEEWSPDFRQLPEFECPHSIRYDTPHNTTLEYGKEEGTCQECGGDLYITDMLGFHLDMSETSASESVAKAYMDVVETLMLFMGIRHFWENTGRGTLKRCLFIKDGPLQVRAQYSKIVAPIRRFLRYAYEQDYPISIVGQEKTGIFVDHLSRVGAGAPSKSFFIPSHDYICEKIQSRPRSGAPYGRDTNYGAKLFAVYNKNAQFVLNIPTYTSMADFVLNPDASKLLNLGKILNTLEGLISYRHENALLPVELAHSIASLSTYPSAKVLELFATAHANKSASQST